MIQEYIASKTSQGVDSSGISLYPTTRTDINGNIVDTYEVQVDSSYDAAALAAYIKAAIDADDGTIYGDYKVDEATATAGSGSSVIATLEGDEYGYYFINTNLGSLAILDSTTSTAKITEKNDAPSADKEVVEIESEAVTGDADKTVKIGDEVEYQITITGGEGFVDYDIVATDILSAGLTAPAASAVVVTDNKGSGHTWTYGIDYTVSIEDEYEQSVATGRTIMKITLLCADNSGNYLSSLTSESDEIYITYTATVNSNAALYANTSTGIANDVTISYGRDGYYEVTTDTKKVYTFRFGIYKYSGAGSGLAGAKFSIYDSTGQTKLGFVATTGAEPSEYVYYRLATDEELNDPDSYGVLFEFETVGSPDTLMLEGLDVGTYIVKETEAPSGYNILNGEITVEIDSDGE